MADAADIAPPSRLWKQLPADRRLMAADAFWRDDNADVERAEVLAAIANRIKFRVKSVMAMPVEKKARQLVSLPSMSETVAARLLVAYHVAHQRSLMGRFLDALGIAHEDGMISAEEVTAPAPETLAAAARTIAESCPADDVALYLSTLYWQDPETWGGVADLPQLGAASPASASQGT